MDVVQSLARPGLLTYLNAALKNTPQKVKGDSIGARLWGWYVQNLDAASGYLQFWDKASPVTGTDVPKLTIWVPASGGSDEIFVLPVEFDTAIYVAASTAIAGSGVPTNGLLVNLFYV